MKNTDLSVKILLQKRYTEIMEIDRDNGDVSTRKLA